MNKTEAEIGKYSTALDKLETEQAQSAEAAKKQATAYEQLEQTIDKQEKDLQALKSEYANVVLEQGKNSDSAKDLAKEIDKLSTELNDNKSKMNEADKAADKLDKSLDNLGDSAKDSSGGFTVLKGALAEFAGNMMTKAFEAGVGAVKKLGSAIVDVGKQAVASYAEYEQLKGGVEKLFGESADVIKKYANDAYKDAGMNANKYMETVTSFSASLISGLNGDTAKAAEIANIAIRDMSDNANTFGTDIASLENAYQGFAKGNFSMLDNLKLGYGGTKTEMLRLVKDAGVVEDSVKSIDDVSFVKL